MLVICYVVGHSFCHQLKYQSKSLCKPRNTVYRHKKIASLNVVTNLEKNVVGRHGELVCIEHESFHKQ